MNSSASTRSLDTEPCLLSQHEGVVLLCDVSGFVKVTNAQFLKYGPKVGSEKIRIWLDLVFELVISAAERYEGRVLQFIGDAVVIAFRLEQAEQALECALLIQESSKRLMPSDSDQKLQIKSALGSGPFTLASTVNAKGHRLNVVLGSVFTSVGAGLQLAHSNDVVCTPTFLQTLGERNLAAGFSAMSNGYFRAKAAKPLTETHLTPMHEAHAEHAQFDQDHNEIKLLTVFYFEIQLLKTEAGPVEHIAELCSALHPIAQEHGGALIGICQTEHGLRFQYLLGSQTSKLNEVEHALRFANAAREELGTSFPESKIRGSIGYGHAWQGQYGSKQFKLFNAHGREINLAARVLQQTSFDMVCISANAREQLNDKRHVVDHGTLKVKGESAAIRVYRVPEANSASEHAQMLQNPLYARDHQLKRILNALDEAGIKHQSCSFEIVGNAGVGKSTLIGGIQQALSQQGIPTIEMRASPHTRLLPFAMAHPLLAELAWLDNAAKIEDWLMEQVADEPTLQTHLGLIGLIAPIELPLSDEARRAGAELRNQTIAQLFSHILRKSFRKHCTVLIVEDLQWFDKASIRLFVESVLQTERARCVYTLRSSEADPRPVALQKIPTNSPLVQRVSLAPFTLNETALYLTLWFDVTKVPSPLVEAIYKLSEGNLLLINVILQRVLLDRIVTRTTSGLDIDYQRLEKFSNIPTTLEHALQARIDLLPSLERRVLAQSSIFKTAFALDDLLHTMPDCSHTALMQAVQSLLNEKLITRLTPQAGQDRFRFEHQVIEQCVYDRIPYEERRKLHSNFAKLLEIRMRKSGESDNPTLIIRLAAQYDLAEELEKALPLAQSAIQYAREAGALDQALDRLNTLIKWHEDGRLKSGSQAELANLVNQKARICLAQGNFINAAESGMLALGLLGYENRPPEKMKQSDFVNILQNVYEKHQEKINQVHSPETHNKEANTAIGIYTNLGELYFYLGQDNIGHFFLIKGVEVALNQGSNSADSVKAFSGCVILAQILGLRELTPYFKSLITETLHALPEGQEKHLALAYANHRLGYLEYADGRINQSFDMMRDAVAYARKSGEIHLEVLAFSFFILASVAQGRFKEALAYFEEYTQLAKKYAVHYFNTFHQYGLINQEVYCLAALGQFEEAHQKLIGLVETASDLNFPAVSWLAIHRCKLMLLFQEKQWDAARLQAVDLLTNCTHDVENKAYFYNCISLPLQVLLDADQEDKPLSSEELSAVIKNLARLDSIQMKFHLATPIHKILCGQLAIREGNEKGARKLLTEAHELAMRFGLRLESEKAESLLTALDRA